MLLRVLFLNLCFLFVIALHAADYYVATNGSNGNAGSLSSPWRTVQYAVDQVQAGDQIFVRTGTYNELVNFSVSGTASNYITLQNYPGESPHISAAGLSSGGNLPAVVKIIDHDYIKLIGFEISNYITSSSSKFPAGIWIRGDAHHIEIRDNKIHDIEHNNMEGAHGIGVYGTSSTESLREIIISNNEVYDCKLAYSEALVLNGNVKDFEVSYNTVHDNDNIAIDFIGHEGTCSDPALDQTRDGICFGNVVYNIDSRTNPAYGGEASAGGIYIDGGKNIIVERNDISFSNIGIEIASEWQGQSTSEIIVRNNFIYDCHVVGIAIGGYDNQRGATNDCYIVNNTLYNNDTDNVGWGTELLVQYFCNNNIIKNNIFFAKNNGKLIDFGNTTGSGNVLDYNVFYNTGNISLSWNGNYYSTFSSFQSGTNQSSNGLFVDPVLEDLSSRVLKITSNSSAFNSGENLGANITGNFDFYGADRILSQTVDRGAHELLSSEAHVILSNHEICVVPNPFQDMIYIEGSFTNYQIEVKDILGNVVYSFTGSSSPVRINLGHLGSGTFFLTINNNNHSDHYIEQIIKF